MTPGEDSTKTRPVNNPVELLKRRPLTTDPFAVAGRFEEGQLPSNSIGVPGKPD